MPHIEAYGTKNDTVLRLFHFYFNASEYAFIVSDEQTNHRRR